MNIFYCWVIWCNENIKNFADIVNEVRVNMTGNGTGNEFIDIFRKEFESYEKEIKVLINKHEMSQ